jgi:hypothetical protein
MTTRLGTRSIVFVAEAGAGWHRVSEGRCARPAYQSVLAGLLFLAQEGWLGMTRPKSRLHTGQPARAEGWTRVGLGGWTSNHPRWPDISVSDPSVCSDCLHSLCRQSDSHGHSRPCRRRAGDCMFASLDTYDMLIDADMASGLLAPRRLRCSWPEGGKRGSRVVCAAGPPWPAWIKVESICITCSMW